MKYCITEPWVKWVKVVQSCPALCGPVDCRPSGSSVQGIFQAWILEWVAISFSRGSSWSRDLTQVSCIAGGLYHLRHQASHSIYHIQPSRYLEASLPGQRYKFINWLLLVASGFPTRRNLVLGLQWPLALPKGILFCFFIVHDSIWPGHWRVYPSWRLQKVLSLLPAGADLGVWGYFRDQNLLKIFRKYGLHELFWGTGTLSWW